MLLKMATLDGIVEGRITLAFRAWRRPTVRSGGQLHTARGLLAIESVEPVAIGDIGQDEAEAAGYVDLGDLVAELRKRPGAQVYRIALRYAGADPRIALRERVPESREDWERIRSSLARMDGLSSRGPWTVEVMRLIAENEACRAADLAAELDWETQAFKRNVRKLKRLGLTESLGVGYRISVRGRAVLEELSAREA